jgi:hypothetical protein
MMPPDLSPLLHLDHANVLGWNLRYAAASDDKWKVRADAAFGQVQAVTVASPPLCP